MGKNKRNKKWRIFSFEDEKDETHIVDVKLDSIDSKHNSSDIPHKYSQILGDHQTNFTSSISNKNSSFIHNFKTRNSYNNKENYYNQRSAAKNTKEAFGSQRGHKFPTTASNLSLKDPNYKPDENGSHENKGDPACNLTEPIKFNEDEYTRITTPRQDVLFKKGYLSRMNNKTVSPSTVVSTTIDSSAPNSTITTTNSDQESTVSLSTLSPATTPPMDYGQPDGMDFNAPLYYPSYYYDENGILVIPMYNGYNYYPNTSSATSPVYLMPYPYQFDPFFMAPNTEVPLSTDKTSSDEQQTNDLPESNDKVESESDKVNNTIAEEQNGARMSSENASSNSSNHREEIESDEKDVKQEQTENPTNEQVPKQCMPFYPNEFGYVYPTYSNGYYNGVYYYPNGMPAHRPSKLRRRKRFISTRNSHHSRSTETTTDYSDDDTGNTYVHHKRYHAPRQNGWIYHQNNHYNYNQYHYNSKYNKYDKMNVDKNANETTSHLNVNVQEFFPRVQSADIESQENKEHESKQDVPAKINNDLESQNVPKVKNEILLKPKASHTSKSINGRVSKKEIIEGIKLMEQQNINLISTSKSQIVTSNGKSDDEWNVIKNGKKIKVQKEQVENVDVTSTNKAEEKNIKDFNGVNKAIVEINRKEEEVVLLDKSINNKKTLQQPQATKSKKSKGKNNKKKKSHLMTKQDGFEIIEPDFGHHSDDDTNNNKIKNKHEENTNNEAIEDDTMNEDSTENVSDVNEILSKVEFVTINEQINVLNVLEPVKEIQEEEEIILKVLNVQTSDNNNEDAIIDISDEEICNRTSIEIDFSIAQEIAEIEKEEDEKQECTEDVAKKDDEMEVFDELSFFENHKNIAELERDLMENLKILDDGIDIKSPIINPLFDFPITSAVQKWLQEKQNESFESLFRLENFKKLSELYDDCENEDDESDISDCPIKSEATDSDYASDIQVKGSPASSNAKIDTKITSRNSKKVIVKESFCALM